MMNPEPKKKFIILFVTKFMFFNVQFSMVIQIYLSTNVLYSNVICDDANIGGYSPSSESLVFCRNRTMFVGSMEYAPNLYERKGT